MAKRQLAIVLIFRPLNAMTNIFTKTERRHNARESTISTQAKISELAMKNNLEELKTGS
jgi:hypothetical protein